MAGLGRKVFNPGDILLASEVQGFLQDQAVMVFDDAAARESAIGTANFSEGMLTYTKDDNALQVFDGTSFTNVGGGSMKEKRIEAFTASGTFTVPAGVTYAIAHMLGGGGGLGSSTGAGGNGGDSSVAFASGTVTGPGGLGGPTAVSLANNALASGGTPNSGRAPERISGSSGQFNGGIDATYIVAAAAVTPAASITVTVGAGGTSTGFTNRNGGSGYVYIEFLEEV